MVTIFDTASKWLHRSLDIAQDQQATSLESFINDPTPEKHVIKAIRNLQTFVERLAGGESLEDMLEKLRVCAVDVREDKDIKSWFQRERYRRCCLERDREIQEDAWWFPQWVERYWNWIC